MATTAPDKQMFIRSGLWWQLPSFPVFLVTIKKHSSIDYKSIKHDEQCLPFARTWVYYTSIKYDEQCLPFARTWVHYKSIKHDEQCLPFARTWVYYKSIKHDEQCLPFVSTWVYYKSIKHDEQCLPPFIFCVVFCRSLFVLFERLPFQRAWVHSQF